MNHAQIKKLTRLKEAYVEIQELDQEIVKLEKLAINMANKTQTVKLSFEYDKVDQKGNSVIQDSNDDYNRQMFGIMNSIIGYPPSKPRNTTTDVLETKMGDIEALTILGVVIQMKKTERTVLITELDILFKP